MDEELRRVFSHYEARCHPSVVEPLGNAGGLSGARIWRLTTSRGTACLRQWPVEHPSREQLHWIHGVLFHWERDSLGLTPTPWLTRQGNSFVEQGGRFWELGPWVAGRADFRENPSPARLQSVMHALARLHHSAAQLHQSLGPSPSMLQRLQGLRQVDELGGALLGRASSVVDQAGQDRGALAELSVAWRSIAPAAARRLQPLLEHVAARPIALQPALRDVRHDHLLFLEDRLMGLVDFGALRIDDIAADLARCLRGLLGAPGPRWDEALDQYAMVRRLDEADRDRVRLLDAASVVLGPALWLRWLLIEHRRFDDPSAVRQRLRTQLEDLRALAPPPS